MDCREHPLSIRSIERRTEGEESAIRGHQPVAIGGVVGSNSDDRLVEVLSAIEPNYPASPKAKTPPSDATNQ